MGALHRARRALASAALLVAAASLLAACGTFSRTASSTVQQAALLAAPSPGMAASPLTPVGRPAVEGGVEGAFGPFEAAPVAANHVAHLVPQLSARARVLVRPWRYVELGFGGVVYLPGATSPTAEGLAPSVFRERASGRFDLQVRTVFNPDARVQVGSSFGLGFTSIPFVQGGTTTVTTTSTSWLFPDPSTTRSSASWARDGSFLETQFTWGLFVTGSPLRRLGLTGGITLQNQRLLPAVDTILRSCSTTREVSCEVSRVQDESPGVTVMLTQLFASAELRLGRASLVGSAHVALPTDRFVTQSGVVGGSLDLRYTFGR